MNINMKNILVPVLSILVLFAVYGYVDLTAQSNYTQTIGISTTANTIKIDQTTANAHDVALAQTTTSNDVDTDVLTTGYIGSATLSVGIVTPVALGTLTTGTKYVEITPKTAFLLGGPVPATDTARPLTAGTTYTYKVSTTTPAMYLLATVGTSTCHVAHYK